MVGGWGRCYPHPSSKPFILLVLGTYWYSDNIIFHTNYVKITRNLPLSHFMDNATAQVDSYRIAPLPNPNPHILPPHLFTDNMLQHKWTPLEQCHSLIQIRVGFLFIFLRTTCNNTSGLLSNSATPNPNPCNLPLHLFTCNM